MEQVCGFDKCEIAENMIECSKRKSSALARRKSVVVASGNGIGQGKFSTRTLASKWLTYDLRLHSGYFILYDKRKGLEMGS